MKKGKRMKIVRMKTSINKGGRTIIMKKKVQINKETKIKIKEEKKMNKRIKTIMIIKGRGNTKQRKMNPKLER